MTEVDFIYFMHFSTCLLYANVTLEIKPCVTVYFTIVCYFPKPQPNYKDCDLFHKSLFCSFDVQYFIFPGMRRKLPGSMKTLVIHWRSVNYPGNDKDIPYNEIHLDTRNVQWYTIGSWKRHGWLLCMPACHW